MQFASYLEDVAGKVYYEDGVATDPYISIKNHGGNTIRLFLEPEIFERTSGMNIEPRAEDINWQDISRVKGDMLRAKRAGLDVILTLKPERVICRKWEHITNDEALGRELYDWCLEVLNELADQGTYPKIVVMGNEVNAAFMSTKADYDKNIYNYSRNAKFLKWGLDAIKEFNREHNRDIKSAIHIFSPSHIKFWFEKHYTQAELDFDIFAISYYKYFEGHNMDNWANYKEIVDWLKNNYQKDFMVLETAYPYTTENHDGGNNTYYADIDWETGKTSPEDQRAFLATMAKKVKDAGGIGLITWGSDSLPHDVYQYPNDEWGRCSSWENTSYWDGQCMLHDGVNWMRDL